MGCHGTVRFRILHTKLSFRVARLVKLAVNLLQAFAIHRKLKIGNDKKASFIWRPFSDMAAILKWLFFRVYKEQKKNKMKAYENQ